MSDDIAALIIGCLILALSATFVWAVFDMIEP